MNLKSEIMKMALENSNIFGETKEIEELKLTGDKYNENMQELEGEKLQNFIEDLESVNKEKHIRQLCIQNIKAKGEEIEDELKKLIVGIDKIQINNCQILQIKKILEAISGERIQLDEKLLECEKINAFSYDKQNKILALGLEEIDILEHCKKYLDVKSLEILISSEADKKLIKQNIETIQNSKINTKKIIDISKDQNITEINLYEIYINQMIVLIQSQLIIDTIGLNRIPVMPKGNNINGYMLAIDGSYKKAQGKYKMPEEEQELLLNELNEVTQKTNISVLKLKNIEFTPKQEIVPIFDKILSNVTKIEMENVTIPNLKQILNELQNENVESAKIINCGINISDLNNSKLQNFIVGNTIQPVNKSKSEVNWIQKIKEFVQKIPILNKYFNNKLMLPEGNNKFASSLKSNVIIPKEILKGQVTKQ